jgi:hypothetical protein
LPKISGTLLAVKERPKVARRSTIAAPAIPVARKVARATKHPVDAAPAAPPVEEQAAADQPEAAEVKSAPETSAAAKANTALEKRVMVARDFARNGATIPPVKDRPKVARRSTIGVAVDSKRKPAVKRDAGSIAASTTSKAESKPAVSLRWISWAPLAVGILLGFVAPQIFALASLWSPWGARVVFPLVQLVGMRETGLSNELTRPLPQLMLYLQFPLEGVLVSFNLRRGMKFREAAAPIPALHFVCGLILWVAALGTSRPI